MNLWNEEPKVLTEDILAGYTSARILERGRDLYYAGHVGRVLSSVTSDAMIHLTSRVISSNRSHQYEVHVWLDANDETVIIDYQCTCPYYAEYNGMCKHVAAVLLKYIYDRSRIENEVPSAEAVPVVRNTSAGLMELLNQYPEEKSAGTQPVGSVILLPELVSGEDPDSVQVSFRIQRAGLRPYVIRNLQSFAAHVRSGEELDFGKSLQFAPVPASFDSQSLPLVQFLLDLEDAYRSLPGRASYYWNAPTLTSGSVLELKGAFLDSLLESLKGMSFQAWLDRRHPESQGMFRIEDRMPDLNIRMEPRDQSSFALLSDPFLMISGAAWLYLIRPQSHVICRIPRTARDPRVPFLHSLSEADGHEQRLAQRDVPAFARKVWPRISAALPVQAPDFHPEQYLPPRPKFEIYLDLPQANLVTCRLDALYQGQRFSVFADHSHPELRDQKEESRLDELLKPWFNTFDPVNSLLGLIDDDDRLYRLITEGIPALQQEAAVFISDKLKALQIRPKPHVHIGVSVESGLLELSMDSEELSPDELAEIMSRYNRKKRFFRLKNGDLIDLDGSLDEMKSLQEDLQLSSADLRRGKASIPAFRAMYLDAMMEDSDAFLRFDQDSGFRTLVSRMKEIGTRSYEVPKELSATLRDYQKKGFSWLSALRDAGFSGLLADEMGLGKTIQVIALLTAWKDRGRTLVVCPASLVYNWSNEIRRFSPKLPVSIIVGPASIRRSLLHSADDQDILITSYNLLQKDIESYQQMKFSCQIIDEAQFIKNAATLTSQAVKSIQSSFRIALTGTPIENRLSELWSIFDYLMPGFLYGYQRFRDEIETPIVLEQDEDAQARLQAMVGPFILRRLKKTVLKDLPEKLEEVVYAELTGEQKKLYQANVQALKASLARQSDEEFRHNKIEVLSALTRLRQICCGPELIYEGCRSNSAKEELGIEMIRNAVEAGHKVLLFSQFTSMLEILEKQLRKEHIAYHVLTGATPKKERIDLAESFQTDDVPVFCISLKAGGTGLNLTAADVVIHYDPWWNTAVENQASDRAHRIGQTNPVNVYRLILKDTIEEKIILLQEKKKDLANSILSGEQMSSASFSREELLSLL